MKRSTHNKPPPPPLLVLFFFQHMNPSIHLRQEQVRPTISAIVSLLPPLCKLTCRHFFRDKSAPWSKAQRIRFIVSTVGLVICAAALAGLWATRHRGGSFKGGGKL